jgi:hypothetical protein
MGRVLDYKPKGEYERPMLDSLSTDEVYRRLEEETLARLRSLLQYYESSGRWTGRADQPFVDAVHKFKDVCRLLAENEDATKSGRDIRETAEANQDHRQGAEPTGE